MKRQSRAVVLTLVVGILSLWAATPALAHALLVRSDPASDVVLRSSPTRIHLWFSEDLNPSASQIVVWDRNRHPEQIGLATLVAGTSRQLQVGVRRLSPGAHLVLWTSVSAQDGHVLRGSYIFYVLRHGPGPSLAGVSLGGPTQAFPDGSTLTTLIAHWLELLGAITWVGAAIFSALILFPFRLALGEGSDREIRRSKTLIGVSLIILIASSAVVMGIQIYQVGGGTWGALGNRGVWSSELGAQYGQLWLVRQALALLTLVVIALGSTRYWQRIASLMTVFGPVYLALFAASGHGASAAIGNVAGSTLVSVSVAADWLHFLADSLWLGGQIAIALALIPAVRSSLPGRVMDPLLGTLARFGLAAYASIALYITSGIFAAKIHIPSWYALFNSIYGRTLIIKMALIGLMMLVSVFTVYVLRPGLRRELAQGGTRVPPRIIGLLNWLRFNPVLGAGVLFATSVMFYYPVPEGFSPPGPSAYVVHGDGLTAIVTVKPAKAGPNTVVVHLSDAYGRPINRASITVATTMLDMVMAGSRAPLHPQPGGKFSGSINLGMGGHWRLTLLVYRPTSLYSRLSVTVRVGT